jgi:hypothetical protein
MAEEGIYDELIDSEEELMQIAEASEDKQSSDKSDLPEEDNELEAIKEDLAAISEGEVDGRTAGAATPEA